MKGKVLEESNEYKVSLCIRCVDYEGAFDAVGHFAIFRSLGKN